MIKLNLLEICDNCPYIDVEADIVEVTVGGPGQKVIIRCKHNGICRRAMREEQRSKQQAADKGVTS